MSANLFRFGIECRSVQMDGNTLKGYAAVYDSATDKAGDGLEVIGRGAFDGALADPTRSDVRMLVNHDPNKLLGRTQSGTLRLFSDDQGLGFECDLPDTADARDLKTLVQRGDISGMSFGCVPGAVTRSTTSDGRMLRTHTDIKNLLDVSAVTYPAYEGTSVSLRSIKLAPPAEQPAEQSLRSQLILARHRLTVAGRNRNSLKGD